MAKKKTKKKKDKTKGLAKREYTDEEKARLARYKEKAKRKPVKLKAINSDSSCPTLQGPADPLVAVKMFEAFGTPESDLQSHLFNQVIQTFKGTASTDGFDNDKVVLASNYALSILDGIRPQDEIEGMLATQMIGVHNMAMETMSRAMLSEQSFEGKQANVNQATKMLRTFTAQMEALKKYRTGGQQKMIVKHVHVNEGGQAIVGPVNQGGG
jgi:hypothetical protein